MIHKKKYKNMMRLDFELSSKMRKSVEERQKGEPKFSINDWVVEAIDGKLNGKCAAIGTVQQDIPRFEAVLSDGFRGTRAWYPELKRIEKIEDAVVQQEAFEKLLGGFEVPKGFERLDAGKKAKWLDENCPLGVMR